MDNSTLKGIAYALIVVSISLTLLQGYFVFFRMLWLTTTIGAVISFLLCDKSIRNRSFPLLLIYLLLVFLNYISGDDYFGSIGNVVLESSSLILACLMFYGLVISNDIKMQRIVIYTFIVILILTTILSLIADSFFPGIIRYAFVASVTGIDKTLVYNYYRIGMSNYSLPHATPVLVPAVVYGLKCHMKKNKALRIMLWSALVSLIILSYLSGSTTAFFLSLLSLAICVSIKPGNNRDNISRILILLIIASPLLISKDLQLSILNMFDNFIGGYSYFHQKVMLFQESITNENIDVMENREFLYQQSIDGFFSNPLIGTNSKIGGHSSLLDRLATLGIIGIIPLILFLIYQYKSTAKRMKENDVIFYAVGFMMGLLMCSVKSFWYWETHFAMFVFLPISIILFRKKTMGSK